MSTPSIATPAVLPRAGHKEEVDRYEGVKQYALAKIVGVWAAAALPMAALAWLAAPALKDRFAGAGNVPMIKALLLLLTAGLIWQFVLVAVLVWREQRTFRWSTVRNALWLRAPRSPRSGRIGGKLWLILPPLIVVFLAKESIPVLQGPDDRNIGSFLTSDAGKAFMQGAWGWYGLILVLLVFNTVLGEELLFRGLLLPRMNGVFGRRDWLANGLLFGAYHLFMPWVIPMTLLDTFLISYPAKRYQSAWIGIAVHGSGSVLIGVIGLTLVL